MRKKPLVLCILDGWGYRQEADNNSISQAHAPSWQDFLKNSPWTLLDASAQSVGLPNGQMGNSEVGHMTIGSGQVIMQDLPRIDQVIENNELSSLPALNDFIEKLKKSKGTCHLLGLLSPGGVHSHQNHILAFANHIGDQGVRVNIHGFTDGRDTPPMSAKGYLKDFVRKLHPAVKIVTLGGRYFGMDRDNRWDRVARAYGAIIHADGPKVENFLSYLEDNYKSNIGDEFIPPAVYFNYEGVRDGDGLFMANFRADRVRQILSALLNPTFNAFDRNYTPNWAETLGMVEYSDILTPFLRTIFPPVEVKNSLGEIIAEHSLKQLRIAETEKYAHVTFFFNGGREQSFPGEERILIPSPKVSTYDQQPEMSAFEVTKQLINKIKNEAFDFIVVNFANPDMVGHTGNIKASIKAVETIDTCLGQLNEAIKNQDGILIITADHGNVEEMIDSHTHEPLTAHTLNPVPFVIVANNKPSVQLKAGGTLADIAPTILDLMHLPIPENMTGKSLIVSP